MKATLDCLECIAAQALRAARVATDDVDLQRQILDEAVKRIPALSLEDSPAALSKVVYDLSCAITGQADPYAELKRAQNDAALALEPELRKMLEQAGDPLTMALHLAAAGNVIDLGVQHSGQIDVHAAIRDALNHRFAVDDTRHLRASLDKCNDLLFLLDNAGEVVFDKLLIEHLSRITSVTAVVKQAPIINDVTIADADYVGLTDVCPVIDNGGAFIGSPLSQIPDGFRRRMESADVIIGKGQGNYETIDDFPGDVFLILMAKCEIIAQHMGVDKGQVALISTRARRARL